jgi:Cdc6-like AAA superfamily ATPase
MVVYTAPWCPDKPQDRMVGVDFFFNSDDMLDYLAAHGPKRMKLPGNLRLNYTTWSIDVALTHFASEGNISVLKLLLQEKGWFEVPKPRLNVTLLVPAWNLPNAEAICKNHRQFVENDDYFINDKDLQKHILVSYYYFLLLPYDNKLFQETVRHGLKRDRGNAAVREPSPNVSKKEEHSKKKRTKLSKSTFSDVAVSSFTGAFLDANLDAAVANTDPADPFAVANDRIQQIFRGSYGDPQLWNDQSLFVSIWSVLKSVGWKRDFLPAKSLAADYIYYYLPPWSKIKVSAAWIREQADRANRDFFETVPSLLKYIFKYGCRKDSEAAQSTPIKYISITSRRRGDAVSAEEPFVEFYERNKPVRVSELAAARNHEKSVKKSKRLKLPVLPSPPKARRVILDGPINADVITDLRSVFDEYARTKGFYIFPRLWQLLVESGWKIVNISNLGMDTVVYCPPTTAIPEDAFNFESTEYVLNKDYFDNKDHFQIFIHQQCFPADGLPELPSHPRKRFTLSFNDYFENYHDFREAKWDIIGNIDEVRIAAKSGAIASPDDGFAEGFNFEPEWQALLHAATTGRRKLDLSCFEQVWKICHDNCGKEYSIVKLGKVTYYCRQNVRIACLADLNLYARGSHYFTTQEDFVGFIRNFGISKGVNVDRLISMVAEPVNEHLSDASDDDSTTSSKIASSTDGLELSSCWPHQGLKGTKHIGHEHHYDILAESIDGHGSPVDGRVVNKGSTTSIGISPLSPVSDLSDDVEDEGDDPLLTLIRRPDTPFARIFEALKHESPPWTWINRIPIELCGQQIPANTEAIYFKPGMNAKSENLRRGENYFCRESELLDYLRAELGVQEGRQYESESKKSRRTRSGKPLVMNDAGPRVSASVRESRHGNSFSGSTAVCVSPSSGAATVERKRKMVSPGERAVDVKPNREVADVPGLVARNLLPGAEMGLCEGTREKEMKNIRDVVTHSISWHHGGSLYVCGSPGLGKTLAVKTAVASVFASEDSTHVERIEVQGPSLHSDTIWKVMCEQLGLPCTNNTECRQLLLSRFRSSVVAVNGKKRIPLTLLVIDEIDRAPRDEIRDLLEIAGERRSSDGGGNVFSPSSTTVNSSSLLLVSIANTMTFPIDIGLSLTSRPITVLFETYKHDEIASILIHRTLGLFEQPAISYISKNADKNGGDMRLALEMASRCLKIEQSSHSDGAGCISYTESLSSPIKPVVGMKHISQMLRDVGIGAGSNKLAQMFSTLTDYTKLLLVAVVIGGAEQGRSYTARDILPMYNTYLLSRSMPASTLADACRCIDELSNCGFLLGGGSGFGGHRRNHVRDEVAFALMNNF